MQKTKQGISLIVLVITILVMIILAATIIITLNNNGIIDKASEAVDKTNEKQVEELANLAWANAYMDGARTKEEFETAVDKALADNNLNKEDYYINVTTSGVTIKNINNVWIQKSDRTVVKGDTVLNIGADISYDETNGGTVTVTKDVDWKVLGAENGELLIMSASDVASKTFNSEYTLEGGKVAYENAISELNAICEPYGKGAYATGARSITVEDVDRVTGYDKTTYEKGTLEEYGNVVTYTYNGTNQPTYSGTNGVSGTLSRTHSSGFHWYDEEKGWQSVSISNLTSNNSGIIKSVDGVEAKVKTTYYIYDFGSDEVAYLEEGTDAYNMLFFMGAYWLGSSYVENSIVYSTYGLYTIYYTTMRGDHFFASDGAFAEHEAAVRAVVQLSPDYNP